MTTRQQVNETAANVAKLLSMMTQMSDEQIDYIFREDIIDKMWFHSKNIVKKAEGMICVVGDWYPGCGKPANGLESEMGRLGRDDET